MVRAAQAVAAAEQSQASGQSIFWALAAITVNAMLQPSASAYMYKVLHSKSEVVVEAGSFWPHRSSPSYCLIDAGIDAWLILRKLRGRSEGRSNQSMASPAVVSTRLAVFLLGVLPQAIKLFTMRGIPLAQCLATTYLLGTVLSMCRSLRADDPRDDYVHFCQPGSCHPPLYLPALGVTMHIALLIYAWYAMMPKLGIPVSEDLYSAIELIRSIFSGVVAVYVLQHIVIMLLGRKPLIPRYPALIALAMLFPEIFLIRHDRPVGIAQRPPEFINMLYVVFSVSCACAYVLQYVAVRLIGWRRTDSSYADPPQHEMSGQDTSSIVRSSEAHTEVYGSGPTPPVTSRVSPHNGPQRNRPRAASMSDLDTTRSPLSRFDGPLIAAEPNAREGHDESRQTLTEASEVAVVIDPPNQSIVKRRAPVLERALVPLRLLGRVLVDLAFKVVFYVAALIFLPIFVASYEDSEGGEATSSNDAPLTAETDSMPPALYPLFVVGRFVLKWTVLLVGRLLLALLSLFGPATDYAEHKMNTLSKGTFMLAFAIGNFVTAGAYFLVAFDSKGTFAPNWISFLG